MEQDLTGPRGDECKFGGGKVIREGMGQATVRVYVDMYVGMWVCGCMYVCVDTPVSTFSRYHMFMFL